MCEPCGPDANITKLECVGQVQKRMGKMLMEKVKQCEGAYTLERYRRQFFNLPKTLQCEQNFGPIFWEQNDIGPIGRVLKFCADFEIRSKSANQISAEAERKKKKNEIMCI